MNQNLKDYSDAQIGDLLQKEFDIMYEELTTKNLMELSTGSLQAIQNYVEAQFYGQNGAQLADIQSQITKLENDAEGVRKENTMRIRELQQQMRLLLNSESQINDLVSEALAKYNPPDGSLSTVTNFL